LDRSYLNEGSGVDATHTLIYHGPLAANSLIGVVTGTTQTSDVLPSFLRITHLGDS
jgi:hypothetical protein